ncbi:MAG: hypothetical protein VB032_10100, partial [Burkholderiaceae bacterium]|nr:hypothetical protein [Burkholderiaceae bacterium]
LIVVSAPSFPPKEPYNCRQSHKNTNGCILKSPPKRLAIQRYFQPYSTNCFRLLRSPNISAQCRMQPAKQRILLAKPLLALQSWQATAAPDR